MSQTTAPQREMKEGALGLVAHHLGPDDSVSRINESAALFFGRLVTRVVSEDDEVVHPSAAFTVDQIDGIVQATRAIISEAGSNDPNYQAKETANILKKGYIWVAITADVAVGDAVHALTGTGDEGKFADAGGVDISAVAKWERGGLAADGIALLSINLI